MSKKDAIEHILETNAEETIEKDSLAEKLRSGRKLNIKLGADPSRPDLHLGHSVVLQKLREFQSLGHNIIFVVGDYTALIGDPSGRSKTRPLISEKEAKENADTYFMQVGKILDMNKAQVRYNSEWFAPMGFKEILELVSHFTAARILERDDFEKRMKNGIDVGMQELLYPIMQAYDSVVLKADVEIGGTDQKFNMLAGRALQKKMGQEPQDIITMKILVGLDGKEKMSKSTGNYIGITEPAGGMFGKIMSISDDMIEDYFMLLTDHTEEERAAVKKDMKEGIKNPKIIKEELAERIVTMYHGENKAQEAREGFSKATKEGEAPKDALEIVVQGKDSLSILECVEVSGATSSTSAAKRLIEQGAVDVDGETIRNWDEKISLDNKKSRIVKIGKKLFFRIRRK